MFLLNIRKGVYPLTTSLVFRFSQLRLRTALLESNYHREGAPSLRMASNIRKILSSHISSLSSLQKELDVARGRVLKEKNQNAETQLLYLSQKNELSEGYFKCYEKLVEKVGECPLNNEWIFQFIAWYNMVPFYKNLVQRLIEAKKQELLLLVKTLSQMRYSWDNPYGIIDQDMFKVQNITNLYKRIQGYQLDIKTIQKLQKIIVTPLTFSKRKFFEHFFNRNIQEWLTYLQFDQSYTLSDVIWLMHAYVKNMNDNNQGIMKLQKYLISNKPVLADQDVQKLMECYLLKGRINKNLYNCYLKPYIVTHKMSTIEDLIDMVKFVICSQCQDIKLLKTLYELIASKYLQKKISSSKHTYTLHLYTHYLLTKGYQISLPAALKKEMTTFCRQRAEGRTNINHILPHQGPRTKKYSSPCLQTSSKIIHEFQPTKTSVFEASFGFRLKQLKLQDYEIIQKPVLCCFQLDYILSNKRKQGDLINIEIEGIQYIFTSGRLIRQRQIRDEVLAHYGIRVNHLDYNSIKGSWNFDEDELLMNKKAD